MDSVDDKKKSVFIAVLLSLVLNCVGFLYLGQYKRFISSIILTYFLLFLTFLFVLFDFVIALIGTLICFAFLLFIVYKTWKIAKEIHDGANVLDTFRFWEINRTAQKNIEKPVYKFAAYGILAVLILLALSPYIIPVSNPIWGTPFGGWGYYCPDCGMTGMSSDCSIEVLYAYCLWNNEDRAESFGLHSNGYCLAECRSQLYPYQEEKGITLEQVKLMANAIREKRPEDCEKLPSDPDLPNYELPANNLGIDILPNNSSNRFPGLIFNLTTPYRETCYYYYSRIRDASLCNKMPNDFVKKKCFSFAKNAYENELIERAKTDFKDTCTNCAS